MKEMTARERFHAIVEFQPFDRLPVIEWASWWDQTIARWHGEGLPADLADRYAINEYFGQEVYWQDWFPVIAPGAPAPAFHGAGILKDMDGYRRLRPFFFQILDRWPLDPDAWQAAAARQRSGDIVVWFSLEGFFWFARTLLGIEPHLYAFYDQPELLHQINSDLADWMERIVDRACGYCIPDFMTFAEDMSYNNGPMLSEACFDEFMLPYYKRIVPRLLDRGIVPIIDSDGDISLAAPWFERAGLRGILPLERQAGVDLAVLRRDHPRMVWMGAFDKMTMARGEEAMAAEFERLLPVARGGGVIVSVDHQTPPEVSLDQYRIFLRLFREFAVKAAR
ncbi:MAG: uroporphyrinogen decarboxylase family protein [Kiritimatiellia bacterium]|jgi:hypothetical protein